MFNRNATLHLSYLSHLVSWLEKPSFNDNSYIDRWSADNIYAMCIQGSYYANIIPIKRNKWTILISYLTNFIRNYRIDSYAGTLAFVPANERYGTFVLLF